MGEVLRRTVDLYIENDYNPKYYYDEHGMEKVFYAWCVVTDTYRNGLKEEKVQYTYTFSSNDEVSWIMNYLKPSKIKKVYVERYDKVNTQINSMHPERSKVYIKANINVKKDIAHPSGMQVISIALPANEVMVNYARGEEPRLFNGEWFISRVFKMSNRLPLSSPLASKYHIVEDTADLQVKRFFERMDNRERFLGSLYTPINTIRRLPDVAKQVALKLVDTISPKRLVLYGAVLFVLTGVVKVSLIINKYLSNGQNGIDCLTLDEPVNRKDFEIRYRRSDYAPKIEALAGCSDEKLSSDDKANTIKYIDSLIQTEFDGNASRNSINYDKLLPSKYDTIEKTRASCNQLLILQDLKSKFDDSFHRPHPNDDDYEIDTRVAPNYLNKAMPYVIFNSSYYEERIKTQSPKNYESSVPAHPLGKEIRAFRDIPDIDKYIITCQTIEVYKRCPEYRFQHQALPLNVDPLKAMYIARDEYRSRVLQNKNVSAEIKMQLLVDAADETVNQAQDEEQKRI